MQVQIDEGAGNTAIDVVDEGSGPIVVLLHGWPVTNHHWRKVLPPLHDAGYRTLMVTPRGLGDASTGSGDLDKRTLAKEVLSVLGRLGVEEFALVGHDWGGTIGYFLCKESGKRCWAFAVEEEVLPGIDVKIPEPGSNYYPTWHGPFNRSLGLGERLIAGNEDAYHGTFLTESAGPHPLEDSAVGLYLRAYRKPTQLLNTLGYYRARNIDQAEVASASRAPFTLPILAVGGKFGMGESVVAGMRRLGSNVIPVILEGAGHYPAEQTPEEFASHLCNFLKLCRSGRVQGSEEGSLGEMQTLSSRTVYKNRWMTVVEDRILRSDGKEGIYGVVEKPDFAVIVAVIEDRLVLVNQYRYPVKGRYWEFPQGSWEHSSVAPEVLARAELREETGFIADQIEHVGHLYVAYGYSNQGYDIFLAKNLRKGERKLDEEEAGLVSEEREKGAVENMILNGEIKDAATVAAFGLLRMKGLL